MNAKTILLTTLILLLTINTSAEIAPELEQEMNQLPSNERIEIILTTGPSMNQTHVNQASNAGEVQKTFDNFNTIQLELPVQAVQQLEQRSFVETVEPNYQVKTNLEESTEIIEAETAWENNLTGEGVDVAVLDTGIQSSHPELEVENQVDFTGEGTEDENGHGTHVAGIIASQDNQNTGVAYNSDLQDVKVLGENGTGEGSDLLSGLEWAIENDVEVAVMSLGAEVDQCDGEDFISDAVNQAVQEGVFVTVAAGNQGPETQTLTAPGCATNPLTVGSVNKNNQIAEYSSRGPTADNRVKPDVVAPGSSIESTYNNEGFETLSGTSMATPHAAAQAATILQQNPDMTPEEVKQEIKNNTEDLGLEQNAQGTGLINLTATTQIENTNQTNETEENQTIEEGEVHTQIQNPENQATITLTENLTVEWQSINNKTTQLQELETSTVKLGPYEAIVPENLLIGTTEQINREHTITADNLPSAGEYQLNVTDNWQNDTQTSQTITVQLENNTQQEEEENQTRNDTQNRLPPQASETARKATAGFFNPTSPFYRFDLAFDRAAVAIGLKTRESVMEERASEARAMAEKGNQKAAERAVEELRKTAGNDENATRQAEQTLEGVMQDAPEEAQQGLRNAYRNIQNNSRNQRPENPGSQGNQQQTGQNQQAQSQNNSPQGQRGNQQQGNSNQQGQNPGNNQDQRSRGADNQQGNQGANGNRPEQSEQGNSQANQQEAQQGNQQETSRNQQRQSQGNNQQGQQGNPQQNDQEQGNQGSDNQQGNQQDQQQGEGSQGTQETGNTNPTSSSPPSSSSPSDEGQGSGNPRNSNSPSSNPNPGNAP